MEEKRDTSSALAELRRLDDQIAWARDLDALKPIYYRLEEIGRDFSSNFDVQLLISDVKQHLMTRGTWLKQQPGTATASPFAFPTPPQMPAARATPVPPPAESFPAAPVYPAGPSSGAPPAPGMMPTMPIAPGAPGAAPPPMASQSFRTQYPSAASDPTYAAPLPPQAPTEAYQVYVPPVRTDTPPPMSGPPPSAVNWKKPVLIGGLIGLLLVAGIVGTLAYLKKRTPPKPPAPPVATGAVDVATIPPGADIQVNNQSKCKSNCRVDLAPGDYSLMAVMPGYEQALQKITVAKGQPLSLSLTLVPEAPTLKILTDLGNGGRVLLDSKPAGTLQDGQIVIDKIPDGAHEVVVSSDKGGEAKFSFQVAPGTAPAITGPITARNLTVVLCSTLGGHIHVATSANPMKVGLDTNPPTDAGPDGVDLNNVPAGDHELSLNDGKDERNLHVTSSAAPVLTAWVNANTSGGTLIVNAGEDNATVLIDGKPYGRKTRRGQLWIPNLPPKDYTVKVQKQGFQDVPEQKATVKKGAEARLTFKLQAIPQIAVLHITGGTSGATVLIDNQNVGQIGADGTFSYANVVPGDHTVEVRRAEYTPKSTTQSFHPGETLELSGDPVILARPTGTLRISVTPNTATITMRHADEARGGNPIMAGSHGLPAGSYTLIAKASGYNDATVTVQVKPGEVATADIKLTKEGGGPVTQRQPAAKGEWEPGAWKSDNGWLVHSGADGNFVPFGAHPSTGIVTFSAQLIKGGIIHKRVTWRVNAVDDKNYVQYQIDKSALESKIVTNGRELGRPKVQLKAQEPFTISIEITPDSIITKLREEGQWRVIDTLAKAGANQGRFGFLVPGKDELGISGFEFLPK